jgi:hypothetical protein
MSRMNEALRRAQSVQRAQPPERTNGIRLPSEQIREGLRRRAEVDVPLTLTQAVTVLRPHRCRATYILDALEDAKRTSQEQKRVAVRVRAR